MLLAEITGSLSAVGYGLAAIGPGIGVGIIFASYIQSTARQPESARITQQWVWIGFAVVEALALLRHRVRLRVLTRSSWLDPGG